MNEAGEVANQLAQSGDYMAALLISSSAFVAIVPIFLGFARQYRRERKKKLPALLSWCQVISFVFGILTIVAILHWFYFKTPQNILAPLLLFFIQTGAFTIGTIPFWIELVGNGTEVTEMVRANKLEGIYLDSQFRRVELYVCEKSPEPHKFDIPVDINQQTKREKSWLEDLNNGKCPLCRNT